jgi:hypothetical protein
MDDMKTRIVGWSWCKLMQRMEPWSVRDTVDNHGQQQEGTLITPTNNKTMSEDDRLPQPLLDGWTVAKVTSEVALCPLLP